MNTQVFATNINIENEGGIISEFITAAKQIKYNASDIAHYYSAMAAWERKEYEACHADNVEIYNNAIAYMMANEAAFNERLSKHNLTVAVFVAKYSA